MLSGRRFRVRFTADQQVYAEQVSGICRAVWNTGLDQRRQYRQRRAWINYPVQCRELADAKTDPDLAWLAEAPGHCLQQTLKDLDKACRTNGTWKVKFRSKAKWSPSFRFPEGKQMRVRRLSKRWGQVQCHVVKPCWRTSGPADAGRWARGGPPRTEFSAVSGLIRC